MQKHDCGVRVAEPTYRNGYNIYKSSS